MIGIVKSDKEPAKNRAAHLAPYQWKPNQSGNPAGRPKRKTMKEYVADMLQRMTEEERDAFLIGMPKEVIWKMAEGNPHTTEDRNVEITVPVPILGGASQVKALEEAKGALTDAVTDGETETDPE